MPSKKTSPNKIRKMQQKINQKYIIAALHLPTNCYTIEKYAKEIIKADLTHDQLACFGRIAAKAAKESKIPPRFIRHPKYIIVLYYDKIFLDAVFIEFLRQQNE